MTQSALADLLAAWLPTQRWFAGSGARVRRVEIVSDVLLAEVGAGRAGAPGLRHLMVDAWLGAEKVSYQVLAGIRAELPEDLAGAKIGALPDGSIAYDGAADSELAAILLHGIATGRTAGPLRFEAEPGAILDETARGRTLPALASNTSVVFGDEAILKLLRRPFAGHHPDLEVPAALARKGSTLVAPPLGWVEMPGADGESVVLAILSVFFAHSTDAWSLATASLNEQEPDFSAQASQLGEATAQLHTELAEAFGTGVLSRHARADLTDAMQNELTEAMRVVPSLREHEVAVRTCYAALAAPGTKVPVQRIHGDYHLAQVLGTSGAGPGGDDPPGPPRGAGPGGDDPPGSPRWVVLDFEGEPSVPLARRRAYAPALRDVAGMLRSFDYAARHVALRHPGDKRLAGAASGWTARCQDAFCCGYAKVMGEDPRTTGPLLGALTLQKAVYETVYEARHRPDWLPIPLAAIAEASR